MNDDATDQKSRKQAAAPQNDSSAQVKPGETVLGDYGGIHIASVPEETDNEEVTADFGSFVVSLGTNGMINLGHIPHPETNQREQDLDSARHTISLLEMLRDKTHGNLLPEEQHLIDSLIFDLKAAYVQEARAKN